MNFRGSRGDRDELDINLIPLIDVLLVILIFLAATTSFTRFTQLKVTLPQASSEQDTPPALEVAVSQDGRYALNGTLIDVSTPPEIAEALRQAAIARRTTTIPQPNKLPVLRAPDPGQSVVVWRRGR